MAVGLIKNTSWEQLLLGVTLAVIVLPGGTSLSFTTNMSQLERVMQ